MGGSTSSQKRIRKREFLIQAKKQECHNTFNPNTNQRLETNPHPGSSILNKNPDRRRYPIDYECDSNSREMNNPTDVAKSLDAHNNQPCTLLSDGFESHVEYKAFSNSNDYSMIASAIHENTAKLANQHYSKDLLVSNCTLRSQPTETDKSSFDSDFLNSNHYSISSTIHQNSANLSKPNYSKDVLVSSFTLKLQPTGTEASSSQTNIQVCNAVDFNVNDQTNSANDKTENAQTNVGKTGGLKRNSWEEDEDEGTSSGEGLLSTEPFGKSSRNLKNLIDSPVKPRVKRKVQDSDRENFSVSYDSYNNTSITQSRYGRELLLNSDHAIDDDNHTGVFSHFENSTGEFDRDLSFDILDILSFPSEWTSCALDTIGFVDVTPESDEGRAILRLFHRTSVSTSFKLQITSVTRIENPFLHSLYMVKKEEMESRNGHVDELYLYHGTKSENVDQICDENLNWRYYTERHRFGRGVSFSPSATYSSHYSDSSSKRVMFLFKVLVSNAEFGSSDMFIPSIKSGVAFDTSIKDDTSVVVKYSDNEFYPLYKITYTRHANA